MAGYGCPGASVPMAAASSSRDAESTAARGTESGSGGGYGGRRSGGGGGGGDGGGKGEAITVRAGRDGFAPGGGRWPAYGQLWRDCNLTAPKVSFVMCVSFSRNHTVLTRLT